MSKIRRLRNDLGLTQQELADILGISQKAVAKWECGKGMPRADMLPVLAKTLGCTIDDLFDKEGKE